MKNTEGLAKIKEILTELCEAEQKFLSKAEKIADDTCTKFSYGEYGYGRTYYPVGTDEEDVPYGFDDEAEFKSGKSTVGVWVSSSAEC